MGVLGNGEGGLPPPHRSRRLRPRRVGFLAGPAVGVERAAVRAQAGPGAGAGACPGTVLGGGAGAGDRSRTGARRRRRTRVRDRGRINGRPSARRSCVPIDESRQHREDSIEQLLGLEDLLRVENAFRLKQIDGTDAFRRGSSGHSVEARLLSWHELSSTFADVECDRVAGTTQLVRQVCVAARCGREGQMNVPCEDQRGLVDIEIANALSFHPD